ncbi:MAG: hypothetical protein FWE61_11580, partial [Micrococcales bacterium]|nr:hypothetical protein [Micrococcales bacterium]
LLADVVTAALSATTKKARRAVLDALAARPRPSTAAIIEPQVAALASDQSLAKAVTTLVERWDLGSPRTGVVHGWWQPVPAVWQVPQFDRGEVSVDAFAEVNATLFRRDWGVSGIVDIVNERFLVLANELARRGESDAVRDVHPGGPTSAGSWDVLQARAQGVFARLGQVPCLLSEPSWVDLRVDPEDLLARLRQYATAGTRVGAADLFLALTRTDTSRLDTSHLAVLEALDVPVLAVPGAPVIATSAGTLASRYLAAPYPDPQMYVATDGTWAWGDGDFDPSFALSRAILRNEGHSEAKIDELVTWLPTPPGPLDELGLRLEYAPDAGAWLAIFPQWGDAACGAIRADGPGVVAAASYYELGLAARQLARRATPLPPGAAVNLLAAQRSSRPTATVDAATALVNAWQRGLLRPGVPDVRYLDWTTTPTALAATARTLGELAAEEMLAVVWPVLDDMVAAAVAAPRLPAGTAEVAATVCALLPEVVAAVSAGTADPTVLDLPGTRALAARTGSSQAVTTARQVVAGLPTPASPVAAVVVPTFDELWPPGVGTGPAVVDEPGTVGNGFAVRHWTPLFAAGAPLPSSALVASVLHDIARAGSSPWAETALQAFWTAVDRGRISSATVHAAVRTIMDAGPAVWAPSRYHARTGSPGLLVRMLETHPQALAVLWPVLTETVRAAATDDPPPRWLTRVLDVAISHAPTLREAAHRGLIPPEAWSGLADLAARPGKAAAMTKARTLLAALDL